MTDTQPNDGRGSWDRPGTEARPGAAESQRSRFFGENLSDQSRLRPYLPLVRVAPAWGPPVPGQPGGGRGLSGLRCWGSLWAWHLLHKDSQTGPGRAWQPV